MSIAIVIEFSQIMHDLRFDIQCHRVKYYGTDKSYSIADYDKRACNITVHRILAYQSHMRASTQGSGFIGRNTRYVSSTSLYGKTTEYFSKV